MLEPVLYEMHNTFEKLLVVINFLGVLAIEEFANGIAVAHLFFDVDISKKISIAFAPLFGEVVNALVVVQRNRIQDLLEKPTTLGVKVVGAEELHDECIFLIFRSGTASFALGKQIEEDAATKLRVCQPHLFDERPHVGERVAACNDWLLSKRHGWWNVSDGQQDYQVEYNECTKWATRSELLYGRVKKDGDERCKGEEHTVGGRSDVDNVTAGVKVKVKVKATVDVWLALK